MTSDIDGFNNKNSYTVLNIVKFKLSHKVFLIKTIVFAR